MSRIFVIEDELSINKMICMNLNIFGYQTLSAYTGREALDIIGNGERIDLALVDVMIPETDGFELLKPLTEHHIPVIFLTAKGDIESKLMGLTGGAEDYIVKPFEIPELLVRIDKVLKRYMRNEMTLHIGDIEINISSRSVKKSGEILALTPMEFDLLMLLAKNKNVAVTRERLLAEVWGINYQGETRTVDVHIGKLRRKTGLALVPVSKFGYRLEDTP
jgi:DNA-binding response OmpR family regulator